MRRWLLVAMALLGLQQSVHAAGAVTTAEIALTVEETAATARGVFTIRASGPQPFTTNLLGPGARVTSSQTPAALSLFGGADGLRLYTAEAGTHTLHLGLRIPLQTRQGRRHLTLPACAGVDRQFVLFVPGPPVRLEATNGTARTAKREAAGSTFVVVPHATAPVEVTLTPQSSQRGDPLHRRAEVLATVAAAPAGLAVEALYKLPGGAREGLVRVRLPEGWVVRGVGGEALAGWMPREGAFEVRFASGTDAPAFTAECLFPVALGEAFTEVELPMPVGVDRASGQLRIQDGAEGQGRILRTVPVADLDPGSHATGQVRITGPRPRLRLALQQKPIRFHSRQAMRIEVWEDSLQIEGRLDLSIRSGEIHHLTCELPPGLTIRGVEGRSLRQWRQTNQTLRLDFTTRIGDESQLRFTADAPHPRSGAPLPWITPRGAIATRHVLACQPQKNHELTFTGDRAGLVQREVAHLPAWMRPAAAAFSAATPDRSGVRLGLRRIRAHVTARAAAAIQVEEARRRLISHYTIQIRRAAIHNHRIALGHARRVTAVTGDAVGDWRFDPTDGVLRVRLTRGMTGTVSLRVEAEADRGAGTAFAAQLPAYLDAAHFSGTALLTAHRGARLDLGELPKGVRAADEAEERQAFEALQQALQGRVTALAYPHAIDAIDGTVVLEPTDLVVTESVQLTCDRGRVQLDVLLTPTLRRGGVDSLTLQLPPGFSQARVHAEPGIGQVAPFRAEQVRTLAGGRLTLPFPGRQYTLPPIRVRAEAPLDQSGEAALAFCPVEVVEAGRLSGVLTLIQSVEATGLEIREADAPRTGLHTLRTTPEPVRSGGLPVKSYRFSHRDAAGTFRVEGAEIRARRTARAGSCRLRSCLAPDGRMLTELRCEIANPGGQQFLEVTLPEGAAVWSAFANEKPIKPVIDPARPGRVLVPLTGFNIDAEEFLLTLVYTEAGPRASGMAQMELQSPALRDAALAGGEAQALPVEEMDWELYLPREVELLGHDGTLRLVGGGDGAASQLLTFLFQLARALWDLLVLLAALLLRLVFWSLPWALLALALYALWRVRHRLLRLLVRRLSRGGRSAPRSALSITGKAFAVILILLLLAGLLLPSLQKARVSAERVETMNNLQQIGRGLEIYRFHNGRPPSSLQALHEQGDGPVADPSTFQSPEGGAFVYIGPDWTGARDEVILFEQPADDREYVGALLGDGSVRVMPRDAVAENLRENGHHARAEAVYDRPHPRALATAEADHPAGGLLGTPRQDQEIAASKREADEARKDNKALIASLTEANPVPVPPRTKKRRGYERGRRRREETLERQQPERAQAEQLEAERRQERVLQAFNTRQEIYQRQAEQADIDRRSSRANVGDWLRGNAAKLRWGERTAKAQKAAGENLAGSEAPPPSEPAGPTDEDSVEEVRITSDLAPDDALKRERESRREPRHRASPPAEETEEAPQREAPATPPTDRREATDPPAQAPDSNEDNGRLRRTAPGEKRDEAAAADEEAPQRIPGRAGSGDGVDPTEEESEYQGARLNERIATMEAKMMDRTAPDGEDQSEGPADNTTIMIGGLLHGALEQGGERGDGRPRQGRKLTESVPALEDIPVTGRLFRQSGQTSGGALPIAVEVPRQGRRLHFTREGASSAPGTIQLTLLTGGMALTLEILLALGLAAGLGALMHAGPRMGIAAAGGALLITILARLWAGPHGIISVALWVLAIGTILCLVQIASRGRRQASRPRSEGPIHAASPR